MTKGKTIHEITSFAPPSGFKSYRPKKKQFPYLVFILALFLVTLLIHSFVEPAKAQAKTIELKDCRTNKECCLLYLENNSYVKEDAIIESCAKYL